MIASLAPGIAYPANERVEPNTVCFHGDTHVNRGATAAAHLAIARADLVKLDVPLLVQIGDMTENGDGPEDTTAVAHLTGTPADAVRTLVGNHDLESERSGTAAQAAWGFNGLNWSYDMGTHLVIGVSPDVWGFTTGDHSAQINLTQDTIDWWEAQIAASTKEVWSAAHAPLQIGWGGGAIQWQLQPPATIAAMLDQYPQATCHFSGHTHTDFADMADGVEQTDLGSRNVVDMNVSAIAYVNPGDDLADPVRSLLATHRDGGADLRIRDHTRRYYHQWPEGGYVRSRASRLGATTWPQPVWTTV